MLEIQHNSQLPGGDFPELAECMPVLWAGLQCVYYSLSMLGLPEWFYVG